MQARWPAGLPLGCIRRFQLRARLEATVAPFPAPPHQTVHEVFPHTAYLWEIRETQLTSFEPSPLASSENPKAFPRFLALAMRYSWFSCEDTHSRGPSLTQGYVVLELKRYYGPIRLPHRLPWISVSTLYQGSPLQLAPQADEGLPS